MAGRKYALFALMLSMAACAPGMRAAPPPPVSIFMQAETPAAVEVRERPRAAPNGCLPERAMRAPIAGFGVRRGGFARTERDREGYVTTYQVAISGESRGPDRVLLLMAHEPVIWDFADAPVGRITGVIVSGDSAQQVANLPPSIPVAHSRTGAEACGGPGYADEGGPALDRADIALEQFTGHRIASFSGVQATGAIRLTDRLEVVADDPVYRRSLNTVQWVNADPQTEVLASLVARGVLRRATQADVDAWSAAATRRLRTGTLAPYRAEGIAFLEVTYVVLQPMTMPADLGAARPWTFIVPAGVAMPIEQTDSESHTIYYRIVDGTCTRNSECRELDEAVQLARIRDVRLHCLGAARSPFVMTPQEPGPARLQEVFCPAGSDGYPSVAIMSPDGHRIARTLRSGALRVSELATPGVEDWGDRAGQAGAGILQRPGDVLAWDRNSAAIWMTAQERMQPSHWPTEPPRIVRLARSGVQRQISELAGAPGRLDRVQWIRGGLALAQFDAWGDHYRPELPDPNPTLAVIDAARGRVLDTVTYAAIADAAQARPPTPIALHSAGILPDGRVRALIVAGDWIVWTQGRGLRRFDNPYPRARAMITPDGSHILASSLLLPVDGISCEHNPDCPRPTPVEGVWTALYDANTGALEWTIEARVEMWPGGAEPVVSDDGRLALIQLPWSSPEQSKLALVSMRDGEILQRFPAGAAFGFTRNGRAIWIEVHGGALAMYTFDAQR